MEWIFDRWRLYVKRAAASIERMSIAAQSPTPHSAVHAVCRYCLCPSAAAIALLSTARGMARWNLGLWHTREIEPGLLTGESLFGGGIGWVRVRIDHEAGAIRYSVGESPSNLVSRIEARVQDGAPLGYPSGGSLVTLMAWRTAEMNDERWHRLIAAHEAEIELIRSALDQPSQPSVPAGPA